MENEEISFGPFWLDLRRPELRRDGQPVRIYRRPLGILCALAEAKGEIVSKAELMARLWPGRIVEEGNLHVHVSAIRKSLDEHREGHSLAVTVPGRGYRPADLAGLGSAQLAEGPFYGDVGGGPLSQLTWQSLARWITGSLARPLCRSAIATYNSNITAKFCARTCARAGQSSVPRCNSDETNLTGSCAYMWRSGQGQRSAAPHNHHARPTSVSGLLKP